MKRILVFIFLFAICISISLQDVYAIPTLKPPPTALEKSLNTILPFFLIILSTVATYILFTKILVSKIVKIITAIMIASQIIMIFSILLNILFIKLPYPYSNIFRFFINGLVELGMLIFLIFIPINIVKLIININNKDKSRKDLKNAAKAFAGASIVTIIWVTCNIIMQILGYPLTTSLR